MTKEIKKYYKHLDLPYTATEEDVLINAKAKIKVLRAKAIKRGKNYGDKINKIVLYSNEIIAHIKKNGVGVERHVFEPKTERIGTLVFVLILVVIVFVSSFIALL